MGLAGGYVWKYWLFKNLQQNIFGGLGVSLRLCTKMLAQQSTKEPKKAQLLGQE